MPVYDFSCPGCGTLIEVCRSMSSNDPVVCSGCGEQMKRVYGVPNFKIGKTIVGMKAKEIVYRDSSLRSELKESQGVEKIFPAGMRGMDEIYRDVKASGTYVRDRMQQEKEVSDKKRRLKQKDWMGKAMKRAPARSKEMVERKAAQAAKDRSISL